MTNERFSRTPPVRANELFEKLLATSETALKTRERLVADLKEELELLARLQEEHLFPILRQHGMQELVQDATKDNEETSTLLAQLERTPKSDAGFLGQVAELRRVFQQHIRDDKKELLPAVLMVLSDEEAGAVVEKVEDDMAQNQEAKRAETRQTREHAETVQRVSEDMADTLRAGVEGAQSVVRTLQETVQTSFDVVSNIARRSTDQSVQLLGRAEAQELAGRVSESLRAVTETSTALVQGVQNVSREAFELSQKRLQTNLDGLSQLARCRSLSDFIAVQSSLLRENLEQTLNNSRRLAELTMHVTGEATRTVTAQAEKTTRRFNRAA